MFNQFCRACGSEVTSPGHLPLDFCTNCGARLTPRTQNYAPVAPTSAFRRSGGAKLTGREKLFIGVLISIPLVLIVAGISAVVLMVSAISKKQDEIKSRYPTPRSSSSPQKPSNLLLSFGKEGLGQGEFKKASSVAVDKAGNIYVGDGTLRIQKFDPNGKFLQLWNATDGKVKAKEDYTTVISHLAVDSQNRVYAAVGRTELLRYDGGSGKFIDKIKLTGEKWMNTEQEATVMDMVMLNDDHLAILAYSFPEGEYIIKVSPEGKAEIKHKDLMKKQNSSRSKMVNGSLLVGVTGEMFLMNNMVVGEKYYIYRFKPDGTFTDRFTWEGAPTTPVFFDKILALNSKGEIYAYNRARAIINVLSVEGVLQKTIPLKTDFFNKMILDAADNIFVVSDKKIEKFSPAGV